MKTILKFSQFFLSLFLNIDVNLQSCRKYSIYLLQIIKPCVHLQLFGKVGDISAIEGVEISKPFVIQNGHNVQKLV